MTDYTCLQSIVYFFSVPTMRQGSLLAAGVAPLLLLVGGCSALTWSGPLVDKALNCAGGEYRGSLGGKPNAAACLAAAEAVVPADANYAVWRGDSNKGCFVCAITTRGDPSAWVYNKVVGAVSFAATGTMPTPAPGPFPGPELLHPKIHFTPSHVSEQGSWHDIAGAITHNGIHHI